MWQPVLFIIMYKVRAPVYRTSKGGRIIDCDVWPPIPVMLGSSPCLSTSLKAEEL